MLGIADIAYEWITLARDAERLTFNQDVERIRFEQGVAQIGVKVEVTNPTKTVFRVIDPEIQIGMMGRILATDSGSNRVIKFPPGIGYLDANFEVDLGDLVDDVNDQEFAEAISNLILNKSGSFEIKVSTKAKLPLWFWSVNFPLSFTKTVELDGRAD